MRAAGESAELLIVDELRHRRVVAADHAVGVATDADGAELHGQGVEEQQAAAKGIAGAQDELDGLSGLDGAYGAREGAQDARFGAGGHQAWGGRGRVEAAVAALAGEGGG